MITVRFYCFGDETAQKVHATPATAAKGRSAKAKIAIPEIKVNQGFRPLFR